jgi:hypothetical protein
MNDTPFTFAGFSRSMDLATLLDRYPQSSHELTPGEGVRPRTSQDDEKAWMRQVFRSQSSGIYVLRLTAAESHDHVYYVQAWIHDGGVDRLWVSLELPLDFVARGTATRDNEARFPVCRDVLTAFVATYGRPISRPPRREEALESFEYEWTDSRETMTLQCGRYPPRNAVFAMGVTMARSVGGAD